MTRLLLFLALATAAGAQHIPDVERVSSRSAWSTAVTDRSVAKPSLLKNGWRQGQSAAIGLESGGDPAQQGAPAERVEASQHFAGGVGPDGGARQYRAGSTPARLHQHQHRIRYRYDAHGRAWGWIECSDFGAQTVDRKGATTPVATLRTSGAARWQWKAHLADTALHLGATSLDAASSWGRPELHPLLRSADGRFGGKGLCVKLVVLGAVELTKWSLLRRGERGRWVRSLSLGPAAAFGGVAARNWRAR